MGRLDGKIAIVTGGASGIGLAIAKSFAAEGARVCIADISSEKSAQAAATLGRDAFGHAVDVTSLASIAALVEAVVAQAGRLDILINSAGVFGMQALTDITEAEFDRVFAVNTRGLLFMIQAAARQMVAQGQGGTIVSIASGAGRRASPGAAIYSASKAAAISITQAAAQELIRHNIRVNAIAPGAVDTPMWQYVEQKFSEVLGMEPGSAEAVQVSLTPIGRMSQPEEYAGAALYLASTESSYVVGQTLNVDGGMFLN
ncbi:L-iditol 2-dehydrogenase [soil metagenome]